MIVFMSRDPLQTVTLPVLVEVDRLKDADGRGHFLPGDRAEESVVRIVRKADWKKRLQTAFSTTEMPLFLGAIQLKQALDAGDDFVLQQASETVRPWLADYVKVPSWRLEIDTVVKRVSLKKTGVNWRYSAWMNYSRLTAYTLRDARLVMWFSEKHGRILPAVYCPDWKTAMFATAFMGRLRVCPKCSDIFTPKADNQSYCTPAHREAHRVARSRWRAKQQKSRRH